MAAEKISSNSVIYVRSEIEANVVLGTQTVQMAIVDPDDLPQPADWSAASWDGDVVQALVGPGQDIQLQPNHSYVVWVKIVDSPETLELRAGGLSTY